MKYFSYGIVFMILTLSLYFSYSVIILLANKIIEKEEKRECLQWQQQASERKNYFLLSWQKEQCDSLGVKINAPVKK